MSQSFQSIISDIQNKKYQPIYFLYGQESYFIDKIINQAEASILSEAEKSFNQSILYGKEISHQDILNHLRQFPMMASHRLVIVKEAQNMKTWDKLEGYFDKPNEKTIFFIAFKHKTIDKRKKSWKVLKKASVIFESKKIYDNKLPNWIKDYCSQKGRSIDVKTSFVLSEFLGNDLSKISNEIDKLCINVPENQAINLDHVQKFIGISKEFNVFELQNALASKDINKSFKIVMYFSENVKSNPIPLVLASLYNYFLKIFQISSAPAQSDQSLAQLIGVNPFFLKDYKLAAKKYSQEQLKFVFAALHRADLQSKSISGYGLKESEIYKELIYRILQ